MYFSVSITSCRRTMFGCLTTCTGDRAELKGAPESCATHLENLNLAHDLGHPLLRVLHAAPLDELDRHLFAPPSVIETEHDPKKEQGTDMSPRTPSLTLPNSPSPKV